MTDKINNVYQKLQQARIDLQKLKIKKSGQNKFAGFTYYELKDFIPVINELFDKYNLSSNFSINENNIATLAIIDTESPKEFILFTSPIAEAQLKGCTPIQALGAVHTYMKRYLYLNAFEIVEDDVLDAQAGNIKQPEDMEDNLIARMNKISTISELNAFYDKNKNEVSNIKKLQTAYCQRAKEIQTQGGTNG